MFDTELERKWGEFKKVDHYWENGPLPFISDHTRLNVLFEPESDVLIHKTFHHSLECEILPELRAFYKSYNGCRLFNGAFNIYGIQNHREDIYEPFNIVLENFNNYAKVKINLSAKKPFVVIGSLGGDYLFSYKTDELRTIYCTKSGERKILKEFEDFNMFFSYCFHALIGEYDLEGRKIHPDKENVEFLELEDSTHKTL